MIINTYITRSGVPFVLHNIEDDLRATDMVEVWSDDEDFSTLIPEASRADEQRIKHIKTLSLRLDAEIWAWRRSSMNLKWRYTVKQRRIQDKENTEATIPCELRMSTLLSKERLSSCLMDMFQFRPSPLFSI